ncbi:MAG: hypothetical protein HUJ27_11885 [Rhodobacteraceae bacterium]|nr:hypothetical protein [Paracoccaceae bacterium]
MRPSDQLAQFVAEALGAGRSRQEIADALKGAGWAPNDVSEALNAWAEVDFTPPGPRPRPYVSAREAFFYGLMFAALAMTAWHLVSLSFNLIDRWVPDIERSYAYNYSLRQMRWSIASLIVFAPLFMVLNARVVRETRNDPSKRRSGVRKWFGYITLFLATIALLVDLIWVIYLLLDGELNLRVSLKAMTVATVAGVVFLYFRRETMSHEDAI